MSEDKIRKIIRILFKCHVSYENIKILSRLFWKNIHDSWYWHLLDDTKKVYDLSNHIKVSRKKRGVLTTRQISVLSALRSPNKWKIFKCSLHHCSELTVHRGSIIKILIPKNYFIMCHYGLVHYETASWFISRGKYSSNTRDFLQL